MYKSYAYATAFYHKVIAPIRTLRCENMTEPFIQPVILRKYYAAKGTSESLDIYGGTVY